MSTSFALRDVTDAASPVRVGYVMSRFPTLTETFILRELAAVHRSGNVRVSVLSLFPAPNVAPHRDAEPWVEANYRPRALASAGAALRWACRRPLRSAAVWARVVWDHRAHPTSLAKALTTTALAFAHAEHVEREGIEHLHAHFASWPALAAWVVHRLTAVPYSVTAHAHDIFVRQEGLHTRLGAARFVTAISRYHRMFLQHFGAHPRTTPLLPLGLDLDRYGFRERSMPPTGPVYGVLVSSFREYKGHRFLLAAMAQDVRLRRLRMDFIGSGPLRDELETLTRDLGLAARVTFSGPLDQDDVRIRLQDADLLVQPSTIEASGHTEGLPTTLVEAAACGVTMVASRLTGVPDIVREGETGFLAEPADPGALADALVRALTHPDVQELQRAARAHVEATHDLDQVAATLADWFLVSARPDEAPFAAASVPTPSPVGAGRARD